jgi:predicted transcriptional regulator
MFGLPCMNCGERPSMAHINRGDKKHLWLCEECLPFKIEKTNRLFQKIGNRIRKLRLEKERTLMDISKVLNIDITLLSRYERGVEKYPKETYFKVKKYLEELK